MAKSFYDNDFFKNDFFGQPFFKGRPDGKHFEKKVKDEKPAPTKKTNSKEKNKKAD